MTSRLAGARIRLRGLASVRPASDMKESANGDDDRRCTLLSICVDDLIEPCLVAAAIAAVK